MGGGVMRARRFAAAHDAGPKQPAESHPRKEQQHEPQRAHTMTQELFNILAGLAFSVGGWFARVIWVAVRDLEKDLARLREDLPKTYLPKSEAREAIADLTHEMRENFARLFKILDGKADK